MSNGNDEDTRANCILEICCAPGSIEQKKALADELLEAGALELEAGALPRERASNLAVWILERYDLAPKGSLSAFKKAIARHARTPDHKS